MPAELFYLVFGLIFGAIAATAYFVFASFAFGAGYQPTPRRSVETMLRLAEVGPRDTVYDLGAGTGAIVFRAARTYRARVVGVEVEPIRVAILRLRRRAGPFADRVTIRWGNLFALDFREATVVTAFLWPAAMARLRPKLEAELPAGARVVSHCHEISGWKPEVYDPQTDVYFYRRPSPGAAATGSRPSGGT
jgi:SAM-dependent methyltransferase